MAFNLSPVSTTLSSISIYFPIFLLRLLLLLLLLGADCNTGQLESWCTYWCIDILQMCIGLLFDFLILFLMGMRQLQLSQRCDAVCWIFQSRAKPGFSGRRLLLADLYAGLCAVILSETDNGDVAGWLWPRCSFVTVSVGDQHRPAGQRATRKMADGIRACHIVSCESTSSPLYITSRIGPQRGERIYSIGCRSNC